MTLDFVNLTLPEYFDLHGTLNEHHCRVAVEQHIQLENTTDAVFDVLGLATSILSSLPKACDIPEVSIGDVSLADFLEDIRASAQEAKELLDNVIP